MSDVTVDAFQALARSSPWRWRTLHFRHRDDGGEVEAWLRRPGRLLVRTDDGREHRVTEDGARPVAPAPQPDAMVGPRPDLLRFEYDDPMWQNYSWVAMLDPLELSHHVEVANLREDQVAGRTAWRADLRALPGYDPRCGGNCCELLYSEAALMADFNSPEEVPKAWRGRTYPDHYDVALDVQTGVVVRCRPVGGEEGAAWLEVDILEVDADLDALFQD
ncbi:hypothetical protein [Nocardioides bizhenqiangii]|uniref:DUF4241 domain-containing protein n=1 Tax=Nocardioides bizhenqiangii TaxID=3095076 RepID=A0ABZ0ZNE2_9ACTN|nr:hypothetical protein [Nocardioides sp. HM61]WQQ25840.1 hypothetical protein SHK19_17970 [Nocardioides sp. HM61]